MQAEGGAKCLDKLDEERIHYWLRNANHITGHVMAARNAERNWLIPNHWKRKQVPRKEQKRRVLPNLSTAYYTSYLFGAGDFEIP